MYLFSGKFRADFRHDPREAIDTLRRQKNRLWYHIIKTAVFWRIVFAEFRQNHSLTRASALAYILLLTLIPLVVTGALMLAGFIDLQPDQVAHALARLLPFAPESVLDYISLFYENARRLRGPGLAVLIVIAIGLFGTAEESYNTIWKVSRRRSLFFRLTSFTMAMVYSPILFSLSFVVRHTPWFGLAAERFFPIDALPFLLMALSFTTLNWFVPNTRVRLRSALLGGLAAAVLFEAERQGFGMYVRMSIQTQTIYGTLGILPLFLVSLYVGCIIMLFGGQISYVHQNFRALLRAQKRWDRRVGDYRTYLTFRIFTDTVSAFLRKKQPPTLARFARTYELTEPQAAGILNWLVHENYLHCTTGKKGEGYVPARDFSDQPIGEILNEIKAQDLRIPPTPEDYTREFVASLINNSLGGPRTPAEQMTFQTLCANLEDAEKKLSAPAPTG